MTGMLAGAFDLNRATAQQQSEKGRPPDQRRTGSRPNLVLFMPDELRADALACYGNPLVKTPNFDKLASQGTRFEQCHVSYPICGASRCALLTGWPTSVRGHRSQQFYLRPDEPNLFRYLRRGGYDVFWFGKNDALAAASFEDSVTEWNHLDGKPVGPQGPRGAGEGGGGGTRILPFLSDHDGDDPRAGGDYVHLQAGIRVLERTQNDRPFCIFLPLTSPHPPYNAPGKFNNMYSSSDITDLLPTNLPRRPRYMERMRFAYGMQNTSAADLRKVRAAYYGKVSYSDWLLGELMEAIERTNHTADTALFILSDHGDYAGDYGLVEKWPSGMEDCLTHVPLIARMPGGTENHVASEQTQIFDVMATCLDLADIQARHTHFARSFVPRLQGSAGDPQRASFVEGGYNTYEPQCFEAEPPKGGTYYPRLHLHHAEPETVSRCAAIKTKDFNFVSRPQGESEFYLLKDDPLQKNNRFDDRDVQAMQQEAQTLLLHWYVDTTGIAPWGTDARDFPPYIQRPTFPGTSSPAEILDK
jgi:choline-sulfatase